MTTITYSCEGCGKDVTRAIGDQGRGRFCSIRCGREHQIMPSLEDRYWRKVIRNAEGCWGWSGSSTSGYKYGVLKIGPRGASRQMLAHRVSWEIHFGPIPDGLNVCHKCDNPPCTRPDHLFTGDDAANMRDRDMKGRHGTAKLNPDAVRAIRTRAATGERLASIAADFAVSVGVISEVARRISWQHVE